MEFSGQYLTYAEYKALGGTLQQNPSFNLLEFEARRIIDLNTFDRLKDSETIPEEVKICDFKLINSIQSYADTSNGTAVNKNIASENTDGYSINYVTADQISEVVKSKSDELNDIVRTYLLDVELDGINIMYRG